MKRSSLRNLYLFFVVAYMALLFAMSSIPNLKPPIPHFRWNDKVIHALAFGGLGGLLYGAFLHSQWRRPFLWATFVALLFGITDEWHQSFVPNRHADLGDIAADGFGGLMGALIAIRWDQWLCKQISMQEEEKD